MGGLCRFTELLDLQSVDTQIDRLLDARQSVPELEQYKVEHRRVEELAQRQAAVSSLLRETEIGVSKTSGELELAQLKLSQEQNRLYAGGLSARDAGYLRQEVAMLTRKQSEMEDQVLELMELKEKYEEEVLIAGDELVKATSVKAELETIIATAWDAIDGQLVTEAERKADIVPLIEADLLALYDRLREIKEGVAIGRLADGVCGGCHLALSAAEQLEAEEDDPPRCPHCRRIIAL